MLDDCLNELESKRTVISDIFYGVNRSVTHCHVCNIKKYSFQPFNILDFHLKKVKEYKIKKTGSAKNLDLYDAFFCEQEEEAFEGENMIYCNSCNKLSPCVQYQNICGMPCYLIITLNRGKNNIDFNDKFKFDEVIDFSNKNIIINQNSLTKFYLCGIITLLGEIGKNGYFIAYWRSDLNDNFMCYDNDASVYSVSVQDAMDTIISQNESEKKTPYILFYHYMM